METVLVLGALALIVGFVIWRKSKPTSTAGKGSGGGAGGSRDKASNSHK